VGLSNYAEAIIAAGAAAAPMCIATWGGVKQSCRAAHVYRHVGEG